jgi:hypothetical protein
VQFGDLLLAHASERASCEIYADIALLDVRHRLVARA